MKNDYNKTQRVLLLIKEILNTATNSIDDDEFRKIMGNPSKANYHKILNELINDQGELKALLIRKKIEEKYFYSLNEDYIAIEDANTQTEFMLECYSRLGSVLPEEMQKKLDLIIDQKTNRSRNLDRKFCQIKPIEGLPLSKDQQNILNRVIKAVLEEKEIKITYKDSKGIQSTFLYRPFTLCLYREELYLLGDKLSDKEYEFKNCKIRRIIEVSSTDCKFKYPLSKNWNPKFVFEKSSGIINKAEESFLVHVNVFGDTRIIFEEKKFFNNVLIKKDVDFDTYELTCTSVNEFLGQLFVYAQDLEIVNNQMLKNKFIEKATMAVVRNRNFKLAA